MPLSATTGAYGENTSVYSLRQQIIEHIFGTIKRQWVTTILLKGLRKNEGEFGLIYLVYNFRRVINILGLPKLKKKWLRKLLFFYFTDRAFSDGNTKSIRAGSLSPYHPGRGWC